MQTSGSLVDAALEQLAERFEDAGEAIWTGQQVADALRRYADDHDVPLSNRPSPEEGFGQTSRDDEGRR
jgi:hypothetical protein